MKSRYRVAVLVGVLLGLLVFVPQVAAAGGGWNILGYHTVRYGETLYCIGRAYGVDPWAIATQNNIIYVNRIYPGTVLAIPNAPASLPSGPVCSRQFGVSKPPVTGCGGCACQFWHTVVWGNTLTQISAHYGVDKWSIAQCNCIYNLNYIRAGSTLCIP